MRVERLATAADVAARGASILRDAVNEAPEIVLALPTGRTPVAMYELLARTRAEGGFDLGRASCFNLDEVLLPRARPETFFQFMTRHVWAPLGVAPERRFIPDGEAADAEAEAARYERAIAFASGLDVAFLGIGSDGHIAYNLPGQVKPRTHVVDLDPRTISTLGPDARPPIRAITMGIETIRAARRIVLLATGSSKAEALRRMRDDAPGDRWPCTYFRDHPDLLVLADERAAAQL